MKKMLAMALLIWTMSGASQDAQQTWTGTISDTMCGASHQKMAAAAKWTNRECIFECIKALNKYVFVDENQKVIAIANPDAGGLPLYAGRPAKITGLMKDGAIVVTKVEAQK
jgi:hypothetical protein